MNLIIPGKRFLLLEELTITYFKDKHAEDLVFESRPRPLFLLSSHKNRHKTEEQLRSTVNIRTKWIQFLRSEGSQKIYEDKLSQISITTTLLKFSNDLTVGIMKGNEFLQLHTFSEINE